MSSAMDPALESLIRRHTEPLERRLRVIEAKLQELPQCSQQERTFETSKENSRYSGSVCSDVEETELSLAPCEPEDETSCIERIFGKKQASQGSLALHARYQSPNGEVLSAQRSEMVMEPQLIDADAFGVALVSLIESLGKLNGDHMHCTELFLSFLLLLSTLGLQMCLLYQTKHLVTPHPVHDIREVYDRFEVVMYGNNTDRMELTANGKHRGFPEYFQPELFNTLSPEEQSQACRIPFSQPFFFFVVCLVWSTQCVSEIRRVSFRLTCLIFNTRTSPSMKTVFHGVYPSEERVIQELTIPAKAIITLVLLLPRLLVTIYLLWLGCRWLAATDSFAGLIWNVVALEFVLSIKFLVHEAISPLRASVIVQNTKMLPVSDKVEGGWRQFSDSLTWACVSVIWVWCYMHYFQRVLPDYRWDVHGVCSSWLNSNLGD